MAGAVYIYGIVAAGERSALSVQGVEGRPVRTVAHEGVAALVSDLEGDALSAAREVRAHWRVLEEAAAGATVLPTRFGTVMAGEHAVVEQLLAPNAARLTALLDELAGCVQLNVKGRYDEEALLRAAVAGTPAIGALRDRVRRLPDAAGYYDRIRLGELVAGAVERCRETDTDRALQRLAPLAVRARVEDASGPHAAFALAFLVRRVDIDAFGAGVAALRDEVGDRIELRYVGPLPPASFADSELTAAGTGDPSWA